MNNIKTYEAIAREAGYGVLKYAHHELFFWVSYDDRSENNYGSAQEAWKACCVENELTGNGA